MLGLGGDFTPRHAKHFAEAGAIIASALTDYVAEVREGVFPGDEQCTHMDPQALDEVREARRDRGAGTEE
jgi:3-methyl-2-oxobutanoate hydroxymethyltransferase